MSRVTPIQLCVYKEIFSWKKVPTVSNRLTHVASANTQSEIRQQTVPLPAGDIWMCEGVRYVRVLGNK